MAIHNDGTMDVRVGDHIERREFVMRVCQDSLGFGHYEPVPREGEQCMYFLDGRAPIIVKLHD